MNELERRKDHLAKRDAWPLKMISSCKNQLLSIVWMLVNHSYQTLRIYKEEHRNQIIFNHHTLQYKADVWGFKITSLWYLVTNYIMCELYQSDYRILLILCLQTFIHIFHTICIWCVMHFQISMHHFLWTILHIGYWNSTLYFVNILKLPIKYNSQPPYPHPTHVHASFVVLQ